MAVEYEIGEPILGADGGTHFGSEDTNAIFKWDKITINGAFIAPAKFSTNVLSVEDSIWFFDPIAVKFDKQNLGVMKIDYREYYLSGYSGGGEGAYVVAGIHHHQNRKVSQPCSLPDGNSFLNEWREQNGYQTGGCLVSPGAKSSDWSADNTGLGADFTLGTYMSNLTSLEVRDDVTGKIEKYKFYDNCGNKIDTDTNPELIQEAPIRMLYFVSSSNYNQTGYYSAMVP